MKSLVPRLYYHYSLKDVVVSLYGLIKKNHSLHQLYKLFDNKNIFFTNHARTSLRIALNSLGLKPGSKIGVQAYNCYTVFNAIKKAGYDPVFIDITMDFQLEHEDLQKKKNLIEAIIVTHIFGIPNDIKSIRNIVGQIPIIEDCAHSFLSKFNGRVTGTSGDIAVFSFGKGKFPSIGEGGMILLNNKNYFKNISEKISHLNKNSLFKELSNILKNIILSVLHKPIIYGTITKPKIKMLDNKYNFSGKFESEERQILKSNKYLFLKKINDTKKNKEEQKENFKFLLKIIDSTELPSVLINNSFEMNYFMVPSLIWKERDLVSEKFYSLGVEIGYHFSKSIEWAKLFGYSPNECPNTELIVENIITYPTYYNLYNKISH